MATPDPPRFTDSAHREADASLLSRSPTTTEYLHVAKLTGLISALVLAIYIAYRTVTFVPGIFMIGFLGIIFAVFLTSLSRLLRRYTGYAYHWNLGIITLLLFAALTGFVIFSGAAIFEQVENAAQQFEAGGAKLVAMADEYPALRTVVDAVPLLSAFRGDSAAAQDQPQSDQPQRDQPQRDQPRRDQPRRLTAEQSRAPDPGQAGEQHPGQAGEQHPGQAGEQRSAGSRPSGDTAEHDREPSPRSDSETSPAEPQSDSGSESPSSDATQMAMTVTREVGSFAGRFFVAAFGLLTNLVLIVIVGLYLAASPSAYHRAPSHLFPPRVRPDVNRILAISGETLWQWLLGRLFSMSVSGIGTATALYFLDVPSALLIGALTFLLAFIPNLGPLLAMAVAMVFVLPQGLSAAATVIAVLAFFELLESYLVAPLVTEHQVSLPPALVIFFQALMGLSLGFLGLTIAAPLLAVASVFFNEVYRKRVLDEPAVDAGQTASQSATA